MAQRSGGTNESAKKIQKSAPVTSKVGKPNRSVEEIKERYNFEKQTEQERMEALFKETQDILRKINDPKLRSTSSTNKFSRENIKLYLNSIDRNAPKLREAARYYYYTSQIFRQIILFYSTMWCLECRYLIPPYSLIKNNNIVRIKKIYENTINMLDNYNVQSNFSEILLHAYLEDVVFSIFVRNNDGKGFYYILDPDDCIIDTEYVEGGFGFSIDASKYQRGLKGELAEWFGEPFTSILKEYERTGEKYIHMPDEYGAAFKFDVSSLSRTVVPFSGLLSELATMGDIADNQALLDSSAIYRLLLIPLETRTNANKSDEYKIDPKVVVSYYNKLLDNLPPYVAASIVPGEVTENNVLDFSTTSTDQDVDRIENNQKNLLNTSGGGVLISAHNVDSTEKFKAWLKMVTAYATNSLLPQIEGTVNRFMAMDIAGEVCKVKFFKDVSIYTKDWVRDEVLKSCTFSYANRLAYNTFLGISEKATLANEFLETHVLGLTESMNHPLMSSYMQSGSNGNEAGRPETDSGELTDSGERTRNA